MCPAGSVRPIDGRVASVWRALHEAIYFLCIANHQFSPGDRSRIKKRKSKKTQTHTQNTLLSSFNCAEALPRARAESVKSITHSHPRLFLSPSPSCSSSCARILTKVRTLCQVRWRALAPAPLLSCTINTDDTARRFVVLPVASSNRRHIVDASSSSSSSVARASGSAN